MKNRRKNGIPVLYTLAILLITVSVVSVLITQQMKEEQFQLLGNIYRDLTEKEPQVEKDFLAVLKDRKNQNVQSGEDNPLKEFGYGPKDFFSEKERKIQNLGYGMSLLSAGILLFFFWADRKKRKKKIQNLISYLEKVNQGQGDFFFCAKEDDDSRLADEIYKTVAALCKTRETAVKAKERFAENLSNIAHQLKTPATGISLALQMIRNKEEDGFTEEAVQNMEKQLKHLISLEDALLTLARIDAGTIQLNKKETDVFTLLMLAADQLYEYALGKGVTIEIPELGSRKILVDLDWTMEAVLNLFKNCIEHTKEKVYCSYEQNPLYTQICIWDEGEGFQEEEIPHLFERFYQGQRRKNGGIGIGLALSREIIEKQNGLIRAKNRKEGGACFEVRFYCH